jgi:phosphoglycerate dehydrogenase-like enzyme
MLNRQAFARMRPGTLLVNCARGEVVDEEALLEALESGRLGGVAMDVYPQEPPPKNHPLWNHPRCVFTPHLGALTAEAQVRVAKEIAETVAEALVHGVYRCVVNPEAAEKERPDAP